MTTRCWVRFHFSVDYSHRFFTDSLPPSSPSLPLLSPTPLSICVSLLSFSVLFLLYLTSRSSSSCFGDSPPSTLSRSPPLLPVGPASHFLEKKRTQTNSMKSSTLFSPFLLFLHSINTQKNYNIINSSIIITTTKKKKSIRNIFFFWW